MHYQTGRVGIPLIGLILPLIILTFVLESGLILKPTSVILGLLSEINKLNNSVSEFFVPHAFYSCSKPGSGFPMSYVLVFLVFNGLRWEVIVCFVIKLTSSTTQSVSSLYHMLFTHHGLFESTFINLFIGVTWWTRKCRNSRLH
jgi:hypothetical protein